MSWHAPVRIHWDSKWDSRIPPKRRRRWRKRISKWRHQPHEGWCVKPTGLLDPRFMTVRRVTFDRLLTAEEWEQMQAFLDAKEAL